jgi:hypothetical protein
MKGADEFLWPPSASPKKKGHDAPHLFDTVSLRGLNSSLDVLSCPEGLQPD